MRRNALERELHRAEALLERAMSAEDDGAVEMARLRVERAQDRYDDFHGIVRECPRA